jgi:hypothetical protein
MEMSESDWQRRVTDYCDWLGLKWYHQPDSRMSNKGWPDLVIGGPRKAIFVELKTEKGRVTREQQDWINTLKHSGATVFVWRPSDWPEVQRVLSRLNT